MRQIIFISVAKHHNQYFRKLLKNTGLPGEVAGWRAILKNWRPIPCSKITAAEYKKISNEKIQERRLKNKKTSILYKLSLHLELRLIATALSLMIRKGTVTPAIGVWNGSHRYHKIAKELMKKNSGTMLYFENGLLPNTTTLDCKGVNYDNSIPRNPDFYIQHTPKEPPKTEETLVARKPRSHKGEAINLPNEFFFVPFQDDRDTQVRTHSPWLKNMRDFFSEIQKQSSVLNNAYFAVKEHPSSPASYPDLHKKSTNNIFFANGNETQELIEKSKCVITLNSTVGLEAILLGKPVIVLGNAFYNIPGITLSASNTQELSAAINNVSRWENNHKLRENFISYLREEYCIPGSWRSPDDNHWEATRKRIIHYLEG